MQTRPWSTLANETNLFDFRTTIGSDFLYLEYVFHSVKLNVASLTGGDALSQALDYPKGFSIYLRSTHALANETHSQAVLTMRLEDQLKSEKRMRYILFMVFFKQVITWKLVPLKLNQEGGDQ